MVNTIFILDSRKQTSQILSTKTGSINTFWDDLYTQEFDTGAESFEFTCNSSENTKEGDYVAFFYNKQYKLFSITEIEEQHKNGKLVSTCYCETSVLELLNHHIRPFSGDKNCLEFFQYILNETGWSVGKWNSSLADNIQTVNVDKITSAWSLIEEYKDVYECEINVRVTYDNGRITGQYIDLFSEGNLGDKTYKRFEYGRNVTGITKSKDLYDWCTGIIIDCDCDVSDKLFSKDNGDEFDKSAGDVILNKSANDKYNNGRPYIMGVYSGKETDPALACINAWKELKKRSEPKFDYEVDTALTSKEYEEINLGDTVHVIDNSYTPALLLEARVGTLELSFTDKTKNKCTLTNYKELKSAIGNAELIKLTGTITDVVNTFFPIGSNGIADGAIIDGKIETTYYNQITADIVSASTGAFEELYAQGLTVINADIETLKSNKIDVEQLNAVNAEINSLKANKADISSLTAINADIENLRANKADVSSLNAAEAAIGELKAGKADIIDLNAVNGKINILESDVADINTLVNGNLTSDNIQSLHLTSSNTTIDNAVIKNAMIDSVSASKVTAGKINTNEITIESEDGGVKIVGATQQFKDSTGKVRVQIGRDASNNFTFCLFSQDGIGILLDETGIKAGAVPDGLIVNDMVADNANISGGKLDISSVITSINNNTTSIKSSAIKFDDTGQTLQVAFNELNTKVNTIEEVVIEGDLSSVIEQVTSNTTNIGVMQGQISSLISNTSITKENGQVVQLKDDYSVTKQTVNEISAKMGSLETNYKKTLKTSSVQYYLSTSLTELAGGSWQDTAPAWTQGKYMWQRMKYTYTDGSTTYGTASCVAGAKGDTGKQGPQGIQGEQGIQGDKGATGEKGQSLTSSTPQWYLSTSNTTQTGGSWQDTMPTVTTGKYIWQRFKNVWANPTATTYTTPVLEQIAESIKEVTSKQAEYKQTLDEVSSTLTQTTTTANQAKTQASTNKQTIDSMSTTLTSTTNTANNALNKATTAQQNLDGFKTTVSNTYTTKTDFNNLQIGGRNLVKNSNFANGVANWGIPGNTTMVSVDSTFKFNSHNTLKVAMTGQTKDKWGGATSNKLTSLTSGDIFTFSCWYYVEDKSTFDSDLALELKGKKVGVSSESGIKTVLLKTSDIVQGEWTRMVDTIKLTSDYEYMYVYPWVKRNGTAWFADIKLEVGNKVTDWTPAPEDIDNKFTKYSTTEQMNSAIDQKAGEITSTVSSTYTTKTDFNNLTIGGRNLAQRTSSDYSSGYSSFSGVTNTCPAIGKVLLDGLAVGDTVTVRLVYKYENIVAATGQTASCRIQGSGDVTAWKSGSFNNSSSLTISGSGEHIFNYSFTIKADHLKNSYWSVDLRHDYVQSGTVKWKMFKVEKGNKATDWTPAPEDMDSELTTIKSDLSTVTQTASSLTTEVSKKLDSADLSSRIQQSATDIKIGFNGINNYISISDSMGIRVNHTDGSYSRINQNGFLYYNSATTNRYHSLHAAGTIQLTGSGENEKFTITLPASFSNVSASDIILILSMDGPRSYASSGVYYTEYYSVSNWISASWEKDSNGNWSTNKVSGHYKLYNTTTKKSEYAKAYVSYVALA